MVLLLLLLLLLSGATTFRCLGFSSFLPACLPSCLPACLHSYVSPYDAAEAFIHTVAVKPQWRRLGVGTALVHRFEKKCRAKGCERIVTALPLHHCGDRDRALVMQKFFRTHEFWLADQNRGWVQGTKELGAKAEA
eukprot:g4066.t1